MVAWEGKRGLNKEVRVRGEKSKGSGWQLVEAVAVLQELGQMTWEEGASCLVYCKHCDIIWSGGAIVACLPSRTSLLRKLCMQWDKAKAVMA